MAFTDRFTTRAGAYVSSRPSYPAAAIEAIFAGLYGASPLAVADLGAGTGISSRLLADCGARVFAIEPNAAMREAAQGDSRIAWIEGTAEHTSLPEGCVDVVAAFQAWHWFDAAAATAEARRILRPGGRLAVVYNEREERDNLTKAYGDIVRRYATDATERRRTDALAYVLGLDPAGAKRAEFPHHQFLDRAGAHARAASSSYLPQSGPPSVRMHAEIDALLDRFGAPERVEFQLVTIVATVGL